ncbi:PAP2 superfamily [Gottschalkia purinilytica]|uniref:PAP2 superfamily n=1 Tax=Gottschalkia purinilytica TaxID=1503 RepID=A0A0L0W8W3_GOTPU|nr:phosphatase PAP2 family protein [Gottschalkia purinilytica]KNF07978.1 PAP2 superfamily [Gottschalkia purinilytica]
MKDFYKKYEHLFMILILITLSLVYFQINSLNRQVYNVEIFIDNYIPYVKYMIIPYVIYYIYLWGTYIYMIFKDRSLFVVHAKTMAFGTVISIIIFLIFPGYITRPEIVGDDIFTKLTLLIYSADNPVNVLPSLHVLQSVLTHKGIINIKNISKFSKYVSQITCALISLSTVMIKQHSFLDLIFGYGLAILSYRIVYKRSGLSLKVDGNDIMGA